MIKEKVFMFFRESGLPAAAKEFDKFLKEGDELAERLKANNTPEEDISKAIAEFIDKNKTPEKAIGYEEFPKDLRKLKQFLKRYRAPITFMLTDRDTVLAVINDTEKETNNSAKE